MDLFLGLQSVVLDSDERRKELYGKAGAHRIKKYGVEYRVLSNFWIENKGLMKWAYQQTLKAIDFVNNNGIITNEQEIVDAINTSNVELALEILDDYNINIEKELIII